MLKLITIVIETEIKPRRLVIYKMSDANNRTSCFNILRRRLSEAKKIDICDTISIIECIEDMVSFFATECNTSIL